MVKEIDLGSFNYIETGTIDWRPIKNNFTDIEDAVNENAKEVTALAQRDTRNVQYFINDKGTWTMARGGKHLRWRIINAFAQIGDNIDDEQVIEIVGISEPLRFDNTEKAGKMRPISIKTGHNLVGFWEDIKVTSTTDRRTLVSLLVESYEEE